MTAKPRVSRSAWVIRDYVGDYWCVDRADPNGFWGKFRFAKTFDSLAEALACARLENHGGACCTPMAKVDAAKLSGR